LPTPARSTRTISIPIKVVGDGHTTSARSGKAKVFRLSEKGDKKNPLFSKKGIDKSINWVYNKDR